MDEVAPPMQDDDSDITEEMQALILDGHALISALMKQAYFQGKVDGARSAADVIKEAFQQPKKKKRSVDQK